MFRSMFTVGGLTLVSRLLGFVRDKLIASYLGGGALTDVWVAAFRLPNLFRRVFGEGAFNAAFVPMYGGRLEEQGSAAADDLGQRTLSLMSAILVGLLILLIIFMDPVIRLTNIGFIGDERFDMAVSASRITAAYLVMICLVAALSGILNSRRIFGPPAIAYVALNVVFLVALAFVIPRTDDPLSVLCWSVLIAGVVQLLIVGVAVSRCGIRLRPRLPKIDADMRHLGLLMAPGLVSASVQQINLLVGQTVASLQVGGNAAIFFADRLNQLPLGLIGMAAGVVLLPEITRALRGGDEVGAKRNLAKGVEMSLFLSLPAMVAMLVIPREIMFAIFEGGKFSGDEALAAGGVLASFALGTPAYILARVLQPAYFASEDTKTPMRFTLWSALLNVVTVYPLFVWLGPTGCGLSTSLAGWLNVALLWLGLQRGGWVGFGAGLGWRLAKMSVASIVMGALVWWGARLSAPWLLAAGQFAERVVVLGALVSIGIAVYIGAILLLRVYPWAELRALVRKRK